MFLDRLRELDQLFRHRNHVLVLLCLTRAVASAHGRPLHFRELVRTITEQSGSYVPESAVSRALPRLTAGGLIAVRDNDTRRPSYYPTPLGRRKAALIEQVLEVVEEHEEPPHASSG